MIENIKYFIDPPSGWRFGFPKPVPDDVQDLRQWLIDEGYPEKDVDFALENSRHFYAEVDDAV